MQAAWPLAQSVYASGALRPPSLDDAHARALCGEPPPPAAPLDVRDLFDTVAAIRGDDAPSRALLVDIAHRVGARALVVVRVDDGRATARVFLPEAGAFDAATYSPDEGPAIAWSGTTTALVRAFAKEPVTAPTPPLRAPALATHEGPKVENQPPRKPAFYESGWFWGAIAAAAFTGGAVYLATRDNGPSTIHLEMQVPR
jgi:hypothetical protein